MACLLIWRCQYHAHESRQRNYGDKKYCHDLRWRQCEDLVGQSQPTHKFHFLQPALCSEYPTNLGGWLLMLQVLHYACLLKGSSWIRFALMFVCTHWIVYKFSLVLCPELHLYFSWTSYETPWVSPFYSISSHSLFLIGLAHIPLKSISDFSSLPDLIHLKHSVS